MTIQILPLSNPEVDMNSLTWGLVPDEHHAMPATLGEALDAIHDNAFTCAEHMSFKPCGEGKMLLSFNCDEMLHVYCISGWSMRETLKEYQTAKKLGLERLL